MIKDITIIRPRYDEVDQMGYVYHGNYVKYCHQARTELMRKINIHDASLESQNIMMPVIEMNLKYHNPSGYDEELTIETIVEDIPEVKLNFKFKMYGNDNKLICSAKSTVVFVDSISRKPMRIPDFIKESFKKYK